MLEDRRGSWRTHLNPFSLGGVFRTVLGNKVLKRPSKQALYTQASNLLKERNYTEGLALFDRLVESFPDSTRARRGSALCKMGLGDFAGAKSDIEYWIANQRAHAHRDADAYYHLGECLKALGQPDAANEAMGTAVSINPMHTRALAALGLSRM